MQAELDQASTHRPIHILGIDAVGLESGNDGMTAGRVLPWMQSTGGVDVWKMWDVTFRDVVILRPDNVRQSVYNLTEHDLADPDNYAALKEMLMGIANHE